MERPSRSVEMKKARHRALTPTTSKLLISFASVEMKKARHRALTPAHLWSTGDFRGMRRNEKSPS